MPVARAPSGTVRLVEQGAPAATEYLNADLGGLEGHKVNLFVCGDKATPAGGQSCANAMVQHGVVAVVAPFTDEGPTEVPTIVAAGIPYIVVTGASRPSCRRRVPTPSSPGSPPISEPWP